MVRERAIRVGRRERVDQRLRAHDVAGADELLHRGAAVAVRLRDAAAKIRRLRVVGQRSGELFGGGELAVVDRGLGAGARAAEQGP